MGKSGAVSGWLFWSALGWVIGVTSLSSLSLDDDVALDAVTWASAWLVPSAASLEVTGSASASLGVAAAVSALEGSLASGGVATGVIRMVGRSAISVAF